MSSALSYRLLGILRTKLNRRHCLRLLSKITDSCNFVALDQLKTERILDKVYCFKINIHFSNVFYTYHILLGKFSL